MPGTANTPSEKVRQLQRKLYVCAKQSRTRRFHALYDRIYRSDVLWEAWRRVRSNGGAAGIDAETIQALEAIREAGNRGLNFVVDADIQGYFDSIQREDLMDLLKERISDRRVLKLIRQWLEAGVMEDGTVRETRAGTPQGGVISPLLANIYLNKLDRIWAARCRQLGVLVRYADDLVAMCRSASAAREALRRIGLVMNRLGLTLHAVKTRMVDLRRGKESFVFLGCTIRKKRSIQRKPWVHYMQRWPSPKATKKLRERVRELT